MDYDFNTVPAGFQDLIPGNNTTSKEPAQEQGISQVNNINLAEAGLEFDAEEKAEMSGNVAFAEETAAKLQPENLMMESNTFRKYFANNEDNLKVAKSINAEIPRIPVDLMLRSPENMAKAQEIYRRKKKIQELLPEEEKDYTLGRLFEEYPEILNLDSDVDGAIAFHNIQNVKAVKSITEAGIKGYEANNLDAEKNSYGRKFYDGKPLTETDLKRIKEISQQQREMAMNAPDFLEDPLKAIAYGTMQNVPMMFRQGGRAQLYAVPAGAMAGLVAAGVTKNPTAAMTTARGVYSTVSKIGYGVEMFKDTVGNYCLDYLEYKDKDGKQLLTDNEVRVAATMAAAGEAYLEVANWNKVMDMLKGTPGGEETKEVLSGIIANAADKTSAKTQIAYYLKNRFGKAFGVFADEIKEEGQQSGWTDTVHNALAMYKPGGTLQPINAGEMISNAVNNMWEAVPAVVGMTAGGNVVSSTKMVRRLASALQDQAGYAASVQNNVAGQIMIEQLVENKQDNKLAKESPEIYNQLLTNQLEGTRYENVVIDSEMLTNNSQDKEGTEIFYQMAEAAGKTREEADEILNNGTTLSVPMAKYVEAVEDNTVREKLKNYISFDDAENCFARNKRVAEDMKRKLDRIYSKDWQGQIDTVQNFVETEFQDEQERAVANQILVEYTNPAEGVKALRQEYQNKLDELINPVVETMREGMKQGVDLVAKDDNGSYDIDGEGHIGGYGLISNNAPWYRNYYAENKKAPSEKEMRELARNALLGDNPYGIPAGSYLTSGEEARQTDEYYENAFNSIDSVLATLDKIEPIMSGLDVSDLIAMEGLSKEGIEVFKTVKKYLKEADSKKSKEAAAASAAIVAHHAEVYADMRRKMGDTNYTALDWLAREQFKYGEDLNGDVLKQQNDKAHIGHDYTIQRNAKELLADFNEFEAQEYQELPVLNIESASLQDERTKWLNVFRETYPKVGDHIELKNKYGTQVRVKTAFCKEVMRHAFNKDTLQLIPHLQEILDRSVFLFANNVKPESTTEIDKHTVRYEMYGTKVKINGTEYCCKTVLRLDTKGNYYLYDMDIEREIKKEDTSNASTPVTTTGRALKDISLIENSIPWWRKEVNEKLLKDSSNDVLKQEGTDTVVQEQMNAVKEQYYGTKQWMKAPDGTNTKLTEEQWLYAHTEAFKEKYGEWEIIGEGRIKEVNTPYYQLREKVKDLKKEEITNKETGIKMKLSKKGANKVLSEVAVRLSADNGYTQSEHAAVVLNMTKLLKNATLSETRPDKNGELKSMKLFSAYFEVGENHKPGIAVFSAKEGTGDIGHSVYTVQLVGIKNSPEGNMPTNVIKRSSATSELSNVSIARLSNKINRISVDLLDNGEPDFSKINDDTIERYNQAAGVNAETADMPMLQKALDLYGEGIKDAEAIFAETGWHIGLDGKWRFEIPDNLNKIDPEALPGKNESVALRDIYDNPVLYEAYPWLADIEVVGEELAENMRGQTDGETITINVNRLFPKDNKGNKVTLLDEEYRWKGITVTDAAGNEKPLSYSIAFKALKTAKEERKSYRDVLDGMDNLIRNIEGNLQKAQENNNEFAIGNWTKALENYKGARQLIANAEEYGVGAFESIFEEDMDKKRTEVGKTLIHEIQHVIQRVEGFASGGTESRVQKQISVEMDKTRRAMNHIHKNAWDVFIYHEHVAKALTNLDFKAMEENQKDLDYIVNAYKLSNEEVEKIVKLGNAYRRLEKQYNDKDDAYNKYYHLHGEQEARLASEKAEISTKLEAGKELYNMTEDDILKKWSEGKDPKLVEQAQKLVDIYKKMLKDGFSVTAEEDALYDELLFNPELEDLVIMLDDKMFNDEDYEHLLKQYKDLTLKGINNYNAIIVFGGDVVTGMAVRQQNIKGSVAFGSNGERIVNLLQGADQSTFMHEMAHIFYADLKELAQDERATEQIKKDWAVINEWTSWNADQLKEFEGTATYNEFAKRNAEILEAQEKGYVIRDGQRIALNKLLSEWAQERFARGFEVYLETGKAPSKPLQSAFSKFKQWLIRVYKAVTGAGAKPSKDVKEVMDRMIASQDEIDNAIAMADIQGLEKQGLFRYLSDTSQEMWERNLENIQEDVSKKVMKLAMRDLTDKAKEERAEALKKEREAAYDRISQEPIFVAWKFLQENPNLSTSDVVEQFANMTVKEYIEQLRILGGSLDGAVDQYMEMYERNLPQVTNEEIKQAAKEAVANSYYTKLAEAFELQALEQYARNEQRLSKKLAKIEAKDEAERKEAEKAIRQLDARQRQQEERDRNVRALRAETKNNERLQEQMTKLELQILDLRKQKADIRREARTNREARIKEVKEQNQKVIDKQIEKLQAKQKQIEEERKRFRLFETEERKGRYIYRNSLDSYIQNIVKYAEQKMAALPISDATNPVMWSRMAENYTNTSLELFSKGQYELAARQKRIAFFYRQMAELAEKNRKKVEKRTNTLVAHTRTMLKNKNVVANDRYLYNHLMYNFGLANKDAQVPPGYPDSYMDVLITYDANLELSYVDQDGNIDLPDWLTGAMGTEGGRYKEGEGYRGLRMDQLELLYNVMNNIYKAGSEAKKLKTTRDAHGNVMMVDEVVGEIVGNAMGNIPFKANEDVTGAGNETTWEAWKRRANEAHVALLKPETILRQLGDTAIKYIYNPIKLAADNEMMETEILAGKIRGMTEAYRDGIALMYKNQGHENYEQMADKAMADLRTKKNYKLGTSLLTKENVLVLAFNWGTFVNRKRVMDGYNVTQAQVENVLAELDSADWQLVINVWDLFDDYWPRLQEVEANISGVVLEKQEAVPFTIVDKTGFTYNLGGGYYPIKYDRVKNIRIGDHAQDETARLSMSGMTRFGIGLGNTKERMETVPYKLRNDFGVIQEALTDTLHNICMRETVRDVNRIIRDPGFSQFMGEYYGNATVKMLENWVLDCWAKEPQQKDFMEKAAQWIRQKQTVAALGFRTTTALLNVCNLPYVIDYLGAGRTMSALKNFYAHPQVQFDMCMEKSIFLRERAETMDRDMGDVLKRNKANPGDKIMNAVEEKAFWFISRTDLMLACPMWISEYERVFQESMDKKMDPEHAEREAVLAGDAAVRRTFGSGQIQDLAAVQKGSEFTKTFTMYYSFFSVVHNALMMKVFEARQASFKKEELAKRLQPIAEGVLFWIIIPSAMEACIRAAASGDDKDKEARNVAKKFLATTAGTMVGGIPLLRDTIPAYLEWAMGGRYFGVSGTPIGDTADQVQRIMSGIKSGKKTKLDVLRDVAAVTSSVSGLPKTMLDGMITAMQFIDHGKMNADDIMHYMWAIAFDKNPDKKK